ncbi:MAG: molecular chaperone HtpG [Lachnospiraceae bacterium]|nr:molecular chaperone HtpG [Lachnospiraceae bacterium]
MSTEKGNLSINSENIFPIIKKWLYSDHDIFYRELISNGCDAITKLKKLSMIGEFEEPENNEYKIEVRVNQEEKTIKVIDNGIGMTADEVKEYINQIAFSGAADFLEKYKDKANEDQIIGHFGLGFYSAFMVAHKVTIDTLSYKKDAKAVHWVSEEGMSFEMSDSERTERGTEITLYLNEDSYEFSNEYKAKEVLEKYCSFMPVPIYFVNENAKPEEPKEEDKTDKKEGEEEEKKGPKPINDTTPLWTKHPNDCKEEDYKTFYRSVFHDYREPLFWIHLNMDYPFNLKGILYFPKLNLDYDKLEGVIKLYSNQVFIADNIKEVIPEFLMLLKGVIDCPDLPLNVSRSALQNDGFVKKISDYITKKVADKLTGMFNVDRENYEKYWDDISPFIKYGCLKDNKFKDKVKDSMLFKDLNGKYLTLQEYLDAEYSKKDGEKTEAESTEEAKADSEKQEDGFYDQEADKPEKVEGDVVDTDGEVVDSKEEVSDEDADDADEKKEPEKQKVYYVTDEKQQSQYIKMFKDEGMNAVLLTHNIDNPFISQLEADNEKIAFLRVDADVTDSLKADVDKKEQKTIDKEQKALEKLFKDVLKNDKLEVKVQKLKNEKVSSVITLSEENRRMNDMMKMYGMGDMDNDMYGGNVTLTLNSENELVKYVYANKKGKNTELIIHQLYDLAMLSHKPLAPEAMTAFIERSNEIMQILTQG